ncbi:LOW QUALITY PROTEIN: hypothetical protein Cgig2_019280 [Carnegiea gigantea]|uniref:Uncharacterized protein n=1 Tax=Carnegiea gigantea TaxID=171969 RepID=A0A9Q1KPL1_9CARY|nr:LOW QUALITY PROTEIN: hypothetical protein Cgig2_019280 [Carnegiea gigantea]
MTQAALYLGPPSIPLTAGSWLSFEDGSIHRVRIPCYRSAKWMDIWVGSNSDCLLRSYILSWNFTPATPALLKYPSTQTCEGKILIGKNLVNDNKMPNKEGGLSTTFLIFICVVVLCLFVLLNLYCNSKRSRYSKGFAFLRRPRKKHRQRPPNRPRRFSAAELYLATKGFNDWEILGNDSCGVLYKRGFARWMLRCCQPDLTAILGLSRHGSEAIFEEGWAIRSGIQVWFRSEDGATIPGSSWWLMSKCSMAVLMNGCLEVEFYPGSDISRWRRTLQTGNFSLGDPIGVDPASSWSIDVFNFGIFALEVVAERKRRVEDTGRDGLGEGEMDLLDYASMMHDRNETMRRVDRRMGSRIDPEQAIGVVNI